MTLLDAVAAGRKAGSRPRRFALPDVLSNTLLAWGVPIALLAVWQGGATLGLLSADILPSPSSVLTALLRLIRSGVLWHNIEISFLRALAGLAIGGGLGFALGLANGLSRLAESLTDTSLQMARNVPHLAMIPLVILWFGIDESAKIFLVALGVFFPVYINTLHGIRSVDPQRIMFQEPRLLPWARVIGNVEVGVETSADRAAARRQSLEAIASVGLEPRAEAWPSVLSGGQKQRVALARARLAAAFIGPRRTARRPRCVDAHRDAAADRARLVAARLHGGARHA